ncbi:MAG: hypothetical protein IJY70_03905 [Clostridia bacterium]|nr:hypothetical protein [Clostridia bacterium]
MKKQERTRERKKSFRDVLLSLVINNWQYKIFAVVFGAVLWLLMVGL